MKSKKNTKLKESISDLATSFDVSLITTLAVWIAGFFIISATTKLKGHVQPEIYAVCLLVITVLLFLMVIVYHQTRILRILHILKRMDGKRK